MIRSTKSNRSVKWLKRNSLQNNKCVEYIKNLCYFYGLDFKQENNCIFISGYKLYVDENLICVIFENNGITKKYYNDSCWIDAIKDILKTK